MSIPTMTDEQLIQFLEKEGFKHIRKLPDDEEFVAILPLAFSTSVCCGIDATTPFKYRWCFAKEEDALEFLQGMQEYDDIPKDLGVLVGHRYNARKPLVVLRDERGFIRGA